MTLQQLTYLVKVAECGNITDAAEQVYSFAVNAFVDVVNALQHMSAAVTSIRLMQAVEPTMQSLRYCLARRMQPVTIWSLMMRDPADSLPARSETN